MPKPRKKKKQKEHKKKIKAFRKDLRKAVDRIYIENQTVEKVMKIAHRLARVHGVGTDEMLKAVKDLKLPKKIAWVWRGSNTASSFGRRPTGVRFQCGFRSLCCATR